MIMKTPLGSKIVFFLCVTFFLNGCELSSDNDSIVDISHIKNMKEGDIVKLRDISQGDWDVVCVFSLSITYCEILFSKSGV